jgi:hypothetical protein
MGKNKKNPCDENFHTWAPLMSSPPTGKALDPGSRIRNTAQKIILSFFALMFCLIDPMSLCSAVSVANKTIRLPINTANLTAFTVPQSSPDNRDQLQKHCSKN